MKSMNVVAIVATLVLAACGSRDWRPATNAKGVEDVNTKAGRSFSDHDANDPSTLALLSSIGGASLKEARREDNSEVAEGFVTVQLVLKDSCEQFQQVVPVDTGVSNGYEATVTNSSLKEEREGHGWFETKCVGKDNSCDQVAILFKHDHEGKRAQAVVTFSKNQYGNYQVLPAQNSGVAMVEADEFLSQRNSKCEVQPKDDTILREQE